MGQICIDKDFRKQGIFKGLYQFMVKMVTEYKFTSIITEIDTQNQRSLNAHEAVGFKKLADYPADDKIWRIVILKV
jgi:L-amino acid N-acyltransferase YncA